MSSDQSQTSDSSDSGNDLVAPVRTLAPRQSPAGFLLGAACAATLVLGATLGTMFLSQRFLAPMPPTSGLGFSRLTTPSLSLDLGRESRTDGALG